MSTANSLSFLPENYLINKAKRRANLLCASLFFIVVAFIGMAYLLNSRSLRKIELQHAAVQRQYADAANRINQVKQLQQKQQVISQQAELASSLLEKVPRSNLLAEVTNSLPPGVSLVDLTMQSRERQAASSPPQAANSATNSSAVKKPADPPVKLYDVSIDLTGIAADDVQVAQFIRNLSGSKLFKEVNLVVVEQDKIGDDPVRKFQLNMMINPAADLQQDGAK
jgi:Tfp pilus assembly protein PilN